MGFVYPPRALSKEEFVAAGFRDLKFERWIKYANGIGPIRWLFDFIFRKEDAIKYFDDMAVIVGKKGTRHDK